MHHSGQIHEYFQTFAHQRPSAPAVILEDQHLTYTDLNLAAEALALELLTRGMQAQEAVGVLAERSAGLPAAFLAILKANGVYVPMVADLPGDRLANIAQQAGIRKIIALDGIAPPAVLLNALAANGAPEATEAILRPEDLPPHRQGSQPFPAHRGAMTDMAAILFTSGSTGKPKGVMIRHDSCVNMALGHIAAHGITGEDRILLSTSPGFILGFRELCLPLMAGAAFVPVSRAIIDAPDRLLAVMARHRVSIALFTPSYLRLLNGVVPRGLRCLITAGERPNADDARQYARHVDYWNVHGATEVCGTICMHQVDPDGKGPLPSGRPFANTAVYLLDGQGNEVPRGEVGEIHIVGVGVSGGYLGQPLLTAQSFIETRYGRAFRTFDLARWNSNGDLEALGRADDVVKVSGQSVSLGEIERTLQRYAGVRRAMAMQVKGVLVACVECPDLDPTQSVDWREFLGRTLPSYMIPAQVAILAKMPISSAGKVDRRAVLELATSVFAEARALQSGTPPQGALEQAIAGIWEEVLDIRPILREDNFFAVGGTSLMAIAVSQRLQAAGHKVPVQMLLASLTVAALAKRIAALEEPSATGDAAVLENKATTDQEGFWIASEIGLNPAASHIVRVLGVQGRVPHPSAWQAAWTRLIDRHPALRTAFYKDGSGVLRWRTVASGDLAGTTKLLLDRCASSEAASDRIAFWANQRFQLTAPPLIRAGLIEIENDQTLFWLVLHHCVVDGMSAQLILNDLLALLGKSVLPTVPHGVAMASHSEQHYLLSNRAASDREFWRNRLDTLAADDNEAFSDYVSERPRPALPSGLGAPPLTEPLDGDTVAALGRLARAHGTGLHALLLAILGAEVRRRKGLTHAIIGSGISLRPAGGEAAIGHFVNVLPVFLDQTAEAPFSTLLGNAQAALTETVEHAAYPAGLLSREFRQRHPELRRSARASLFDIALTAIPPRTFVDQEIGLSLTPRLLPGGLEHPAAGLDFSFSHEPRPEDGGLNLLLTWNPDVCSEGTAKAWLSAFATWARWLAEEPERIDQQLPALLPLETALLAQWEQGPILPRQAYRSHEIFEAWVDRQPLSPAIVGQGTPETFAQLDARANGLAHGLQLQGVVAGTMVAVLTVGSADLPAAVLGIWKAGGIYLPLAQELPPARLAAMARDAGAAVLLVLDGLSVPPPLADSVKTILRLEECPPSHQRPQVTGAVGDTAYIVYTSGTTGMPKGVPITHAGYTNIVLGVAKTVDILPADRIALATTVGFDASLWELGHGLFNGIALVPVSRQLRDDPWALKRYYRDLGVTIAFHTPSYLRVSEQVPFEGLRILLTGGEAPSHRDVHQHAGQLAFWNFYGPAEAAIVVAGGQIPSDPAPDRPLTVGRPLANVRISLRHDDGAPVPPGQQGEVWLGGVGITNGYLNRPELNAERFVTTPEGRFYRSGDYGRWTAEGQLEICGRFDHQVKLNGQRVELGEVEQTLRTHPAVIDAVVLAEDLATGAKVLRAFVRLTDPAPAAAKVAAKVTDFLAVHLPAHMVPASITAVAAIPLTPAGKIDRRLLLSNFARQPRQLKEAQANEAPENPLEIRMAAIWAEVLQVAVVGRHDNFFALGGNSLLAVTLAHRLSQRLGQQVSMRSLFTAPTLAAFAETISSPTAVERPIGIASDPDLASLASLASTGEGEFWTTEVAGFDTRAFIMPMHYRVVGKVPFDRWQEAWATLVDRHEALRTSFAEDGAGQLRRQVAPPTEGRVEFAELPDQQSAWAHIRQRQRTPLSMGVAPLWRVGLVEIQEEGGSYFFWLAVHHAIGDGQSIGTLLAELTILLAGETLPPPSGNASLFSGREQRYLASAEATNDATYWRNLINSVPIAAFDQWPMDRARSLLAPSGNHRFTRTFDLRTTRALQTLARGCAASLHALMLTLMAVEMRRRTGRTDILIGTTASLRESIADMDIVGYGVNMLPLHLKPGAAPCFSALLRTTQHSLAETLQHGRYPFARIYRSFWSEHPELRHPQRYPLFDVAVTENPGAGTGRAPQRFLRAAMATASISYERTEVSPGLDMILLHEVLDNGELMLQLQVDAALYAEETARNWMTALSGWLGWLAEEPERVDQRLPALLPLETAQLAQWEQGPIRPRRGQRSHEIFESWVDRQPLSPAIVGQGTLETFAQLDARANGLAHGLQLQGAVAGTLVAVLTVGSADLPAAVLGIWKAGGIYLPLAQELPPARLAAMAGDAGAALAGDAGAALLLVLDGLEVPQALADSVGTILRLEDCPPSHQRPQVAGAGGDTAYIVYTSGTTGMPKGVPVSHAGYTNIILGVAETVGILPEDRIALVATVGFDASLWELGHGLFNGIALVPVSRQLRDDPWALKRYYRDLGVTIAFHTPSYLRVSEQVPFEGLRILLTGGEAPSHRDVHQHAGRLAFWNFYGPTEATIVVAGGQIPSDLDPDRPLTVGRPLANVRISLRHDDGTPVPPGQQGELWLGGVGITNGYLNRSELNADRFVTTPEGRFYRSGDYGRWTADGQLEICGRFDQQVKLNGQRVEPGEVEQTLRTHPAVIDAVVLAEDLATGAKVLRAFVRLTDPAPAAAKVAEFLAVHLPAHMVPASITAVAAIPLTPAGKIDRRLLLANFARQQQEAQANETPENPLEIRMAAIWAEVLQVAVVGRHDNFFALGGNSLLAVTLAHRVSERLGQQIPARSLFTAPTLATFVARIGLLPTVENAIEFVAETDLATVGEREFWTAETAGLDTRTFTIPVQYLVLGDITAEQWHSAWSTLVARHAGLRTFFNEDATGQLRRRVVPTIEVAMEYAVLADRSAALPHIRQRQAAALPMGVAPLWRTGLVQTQKDGLVYFWLALHHAVGDGQSIGTLLAELTTLLAGKTLPPPGAGASLLSVREQAYFASKEATDDAEYWGTLLKRVPVTAFDEWPLDKIRSAQALTGNHRFQVTLDLQTSTALKALARRQAASVHALMLTLLALEVGRRTGRTDVLIGTTASIRESVADMDIVGYGVNMLPLHLRPGAHPCFGELLRTTQHRLAEALQHARRPFAHIYRAFWSERPELRHPQRYPLFDLAVTENPGVGQAAVPPRFTRATAATETLTYECTEASPGQDMVLIHEELGTGAFLLQLQLNAAIYSQETARRWFESLVGWARWLAEDPAQAAQPLPRLLPDEAALLARWEQGTCRQRPRVRFHQLFEERVDRPGQADRPAVVNLEHHRSYRALEEEANALAHALRQRGIGRNSIVAILTGRSAHLPAAALAVWKAGATYLPLASDLPPERLAFMATDARASQLIALDGVAVTGPLASALPDCLRPETLSEDFRRKHSGRPNIPGDPADIAYILYTSGSTGEPKGTLISHESYVNLVLGAVEAYDLTADDRCLMFASPSFDVSLSDLGVPLACGATICPASSAIIESPTLFLKFLRELGVTLADITPTYLRLFEGCDLPPAVRILVTGGEPPVSVDVATYAPRLRFFNAYGPTENTITSCMGVLNGDEQGPLTAGRPLPNTSIHICDHKGQPLPPTVVGEIWLGGVGLCQGYLHRPELTAAHFLETPWGRRYRSGDLGRWNTDGELEILGRIDDQVKLNGIRIELGEIEHALTSSAVVSQAVALLVDQGGGTKSLWAVVRLLPGEQMPTEEDWRAFLAQRLPSHMLPAGVLSLPALPLSVAGKVDRAALQAAVLAARPTISGLTLPQDDLERCIADVWGSILGRNPIHRQDNFFALGGHSLLAIVVAHRLEKTLGREVPAREIFAEPTLSAFAARLRSAKPTESNLEASTNLATVGQREFWTAERAGLDTRGFSIPLTLAVRGEVPAPEQWCLAWDALAARHDALRTGFFEDESGDLRRLIVERPEARFEIRRASSRTQALAGIKDQVLEPFAMGIPGLWRAGLTHIAENNEAIFWFVMHHAVGDGLSLGILIDELTRLLQNNVPAPPPFSFDHSAARETAYLAGERARVDAAYWQQRIAGLAEHTPDAFDEWPLDKPRPNARSARTLKGSHCFRYRLDPVTADGLRSLAQRNGASLHAFMLALLGLEVRRRTGRSEFLLGTAASTRQSADEAQTIGYFVNMLPLSFRVDQSASIDTAIRAMQQELGEALQHARYPFARIYGDFRREQPQATQPARYPLFDIAVTENPSISLSTETDLSFAGIGAPEPGVMRYELLRNAPAQDLVLIHEGQPDHSLILIWFANAMIYTEDTAQLWFDSLVGWTEYLAQNLPKEGARLPWLLPAEKRLLAGWQQGPRRALPGPTFSDLFRRLAMAHPQRPALITATGVQSYQAVNACADRLARALLALDLQRGEVVAVLTERSAALPATVLALWQAGGCYLPLTADLPGERLAFMAQDAGVRILIVLDELDLPAELAAKGYTVIRPEALPEVMVPTASTVAISADDLAYILYTSGSTGIPKGVVLRHAGLLNLGVGGAAAIGIESNDRMLLMASPSFDLWISDLVMAWSVGAALVPVRREQMNDIAGMLALIRQFGVTVATMTPSYLHLFERNDLVGLRILMTVGEAPLADDVRFHAAKLAYFNGYGPTENTAAITFSRLRADAEQIAAGALLANTSVSINDAKGNPVPPGVAGEVWVGGMGLAVGYLNRPDLTAASFVETTEGRRYRTGDLGRWLRSGELQILGRLDDQVKLRGQRVELGEIECCLATHPGVQQAVAAVETLADQSQRLRAFVTLHPQTTMPTPAEWSSYLLGRLPSAMIPSTLTRVATIPLTTAGKVDRRALLGTLIAGASAKSGPSELEGQTLQTPPQTARERRIAQIWAELLEHPLVAREDDFFALGGDSLKAIAVVSRIRREFECQVNDLYEHPVLADFARLCRPIPDQLLSGSQAIDADQAKPAHARTEAALMEVLRPQRDLYQARTRALFERDFHPRHPYQHILLTGATGYLGSYLVRELLADPAVTVTALVRGADDSSARARLGRVLIEYFGGDCGGRLRDNRRLHVLASDLRQPQLRLCPRDYSSLATNVDAIYHCAANVNHIGHYRDFYADNVDATRHLLSLAMRRTTSTVDFHFASTLSVAGRAPADESRLFTEYDFAPETADDNYYIRTKQEAEQLVIAARRVLANTCIHRIGNIGFATDSTNLQRNLDKNAFFRQLVAFLRLGAVPMELLASVCHVDVVARALLALGGTKALTNEIHHIETSRRDRLVDFMLSAEGMTTATIGASDFSTFRKRLRTAIDDPKLESAVAETMEAFGLHSGQPLPARQHRIIVASERTQLLLKRLGITWPTMPPAGQNALMGAALQRLSP